MHSQDSGEGRWCRGPSRYSSLARSRAERVAVAADGFHIPGAVWVDLHLLADAVDVHLEAVAVERHVVSPHALKERFSGDDPAEIPCQMSNQLKFSCRQ